MIAFNPHLYEYTEHDHYLDNFYIIVDSCPNGQHIIQHAHKLFWKFWITDGREFPTWDACLGEIK
jgi:hypothetical protein